MTRGVGKCHVNSLVRYVKKKKEEKKDAVGEALRLWQSYLQLELQLSAVACLLARDGDLAAELQRHGAVQDAWRVGGWEEGRREGGGKAGGSTP